MPRSPPDDADTSPVEPTPGVAATNRELFEARTSPAECQTCHETIDGIGMGFEMFDAAGAFRTMEAGVTVDSSGALFGTDQDGPFADAVELSARLGDSEQVQSCVATQWFRFTVGREEEAGDACRLYALDEAVRASGGDVRELLVTLATQPEFVYRSME